MLNDSWADRNPTRVVVLIEEEEELTVGSTTRVNYEHFIGIVIEI
jgi:hypothetical protein